MYRSIFKRIGGKQIFVKNQLLIPAITVFAVIGIGISGIWADSRHTENYIDKTKYSYQN